MKKILGRIFFIVFFILLVFALAISLSKCDVEKYNNYNKQIDLNVYLDEKPELNVLFPNSGMDNSAFEKGWTTKFFEEQTGYKVNYSQALDNQTTIVQNIYSSKDEYHMMKLESGTYMAMVGKDPKPFVDLKPALEKFGKDLLEIIPQEAWDAVTIDGKIYGIPETGFGQMIGSALVWNMRQLAEVGITKVPETMKEVEDAFYALKEQNSGNSKYYSFAMASPSVYVEPLAAAFNLNKDFYVNENGEIKHTMYDDNYKAYYKWLNKLCREGIISKQQQSFSAVDIYQNIAKGDLGCGYLPYWYINSLVGAMAATPEYASEEEARNSLGYSLTIKGDGTAGSAVQSVGKTLYYDSIGYYMVIPVYMAKYGAYAIDWMNTKIKTEVYEGFRLGEEGVHYEVSNSNDPNAVKVTVSGEEKYIKLLPAYNNDILPTSMYQTGGNPTVGKNLWPLSEQSYKCWKILVDTDYDNIVTNALSMTPYIKGWSEVDINSRSMVVTYEQRLIIAESDTAFDKQFSTCKLLWEGQYWTEEVNENVQAWYQSKINR